MKRKASLLLLAGIFSVAGILHFVVPQVYVGIMPGYLPWPLALVLVSGFFEIAGGVGLLFKKSRKAAGIGLILLLLAVWPANFQMLFDARSEGVSALYEAALWLRLPLQIALIYWVWWTALRHSAEAAPAA